MQGYCSQHHKLYKLSLLNDFYRRSYDTTCLSAYSLQDFCFCSSKLKCLDLSSIYIKFMLKFGNTFRAIQNNFVHFVVNHTVYYVLRYRTGFHFHSRCNCKHFIATLAVRLVASLLSFLKLLAHIVAINFLGKSLRQI